MIRWKFYKENDKWRQDIIYQPSAAMAVIAGGVGAFSSKPVVQKGAIDRRRIKFVITRLMDVVENYDYLFKIVNDAQAVKEMIL